VLCIVLNASWLSTAQPMVSTLTFHNVAVFLHIGAPDEHHPVHIQPSPVPPLDGSRILATFVRGFRDLISSPSAPMIGLFVLIGISRLGGGYAIRLLAETLSTEGAAALAGLMRSLVH